MDTPRRRVLAAFIGTQQVLESTLKKQDLVLTFRQREHRGQSDTTIMVRHVCKAPSSFLGIRSLFLLTCLCLADANWRTAGYDRRRA